MLKLQALKALPQHTTNPQPPNFDHSSSLPSAMASAWLAFVLPPHALLKQLLWLLLWAGVSLTCMLMVRLLVFYDGFAIPSFLALVSAALLAIFARVFVYLNSSAEDHNNNSSNSSSGGSSSGSAKRNWLHLCVVGALMGASGGFSLASFRYLPVPTVILIQAAAPAVSYWVAVLLLQEDVQWAPSLKALLVFCSATASLLPQRHSISTAGLALQATAVLLEVLWQRLHLRVTGSSTGSCAYNSSSSSTHSHDGYDSSSNGSSRSNSSGDGSSGDVLLWKGPSTGLQLLANAAPAAVLTLLPAMLVFDIQPLRMQQFRFKPMLPAAFVVCLFLCCLMLLKAQPAVLQGLTVEPTGPLMRAVRDVLLGVAAAKLLNEFLTPWQWVAYAAAQLAAVALWAGSSSSSTGSSNSSSIVGGGGKKAGGFTKLLPIWG